jgi:hypothetical protein
MPETRLYRSQKLIFTGPLWHNEAVASDLWELLRQRDLLIEICVGEPPWQVLLGAPHHAEPGVEGIANDWANPRTGTNGRPADETVGLLALAVLAEFQRHQIACKLVIAVHPTDHDPNKTPGCPYWESIFSHPHPRHILELHGAARRRHHDLELSAGRNLLAQPLEMGRRIAAGLARARPTAWTVAAQAKPGVTHGMLLDGSQEKACRLQNPALHTNLLEAAGVAGIPALHLEAKRIFRQSDPAFPHSPRPTSAARVLARALIEALS